MINMSFIKNIFGGRKRISGSVSTSQIVLLNEPDAINQRLKNIYGQERIELQLLYEKWVGRESWLLKHEALPLLYGIDPDNNTRLVTPETKNNIDELWNHARQCAESGLLKVINREQTDTNWRVTPVDIYHWARVSRIVLPDVFNSLMEFVSSTIKRQETPDNAVNQSGVNHDSHIRFDDNREKVLGIALALLATCPDECRNSNGEVKIEKIIRLIDEKGEFWSGGVQPGLSVTAMKDLLGKWLNTIPPRGS